METRNFMIMYRLNKDGVWHTEYFITEDLARKEANDLFRKGYAYIELLKKARGGGYSTIKKVTQNERVAKAKHDAFLKEIEQEYSLFKVIETVSHETNIKKVSN